MDPDIIKVLKTNIPPSDAQSKGIHELVKAAQADCRELQSEATHIQGLLNNVYAKIAKRKVDLATYNAALSAARRLPPELVTYIFLLCHTEPSRLLSDSKNDRFPLTLGQICSGWRKVALNTPRLWSDITVEVLADHPIPDYTEKLVGSWLYRSGALPISLDIRLVNSNTPRTFPISSNLQRMMKLVAMYANRLKILRVILPENPFRLQVADPFQTIPPKSFSLLESATLCMDFFELRRREPVRWQGAVTAFADAPHLKRLEFCSNQTTPLFAVSESSGLTEFHIYLPWAQLTHLNFHRVFLNPEGCHYVLRLCSHSLVEFSVVLGQDHARRSAVVFENVSMPKLTTFNLQIMRSDRGGILHPSFLQSLILPALKDFSFSSYNTDNGPTKWYATVPYEGLVYILSNSRLERLSLTYVVICSTRLIELLRPMTALVELNLDRTLFVGDNHRLNKPFKLLSRNYDPLILPKLEIIKVDLLHTDEKELFEMVGSRLPRRDRPGYRARRRQESESSVGSRAYLKKVFVNAVDVVKRYKYLDEDDMYLKFLRLDTEISIKRSGEH